MQAPNPQKQTDFLLDLQKKAYRVYLLFSTIKSYGQIPC